MIKNQVKSISNSVATSLDMSGNIRSAYTLIIQNINSSGFLYIGNSNITALSYGYKLYPGQGITIELPSRNTIYAIASASGMNAAIMEIDRAI